MTSSLRSPLLTPPSSSLYNPRMFVSKKFRKWAEEVLKVTNLAEVERLYQESKVRRRELRREERRPRHEAVAAPLEQDIVEYVNTRYSNWRRSREELLKNPWYSASDVRRILPEPSLSIGFIVSNVVGTLQRHGIGDTREQYSVVSAALRRLLKKGKLKTSSNSEAFYCTYNRFGHLHSCRS